MFKIDFFELMFLAESCVPPQPIARSCFFESLINVHYKDMTETERKEAFKWITELDCFDIKNDLCALFHSRFNPDNQFLVYTKISSKDRKSLTETSHENFDSEIECFLHKEHYCKSQNRFINPTYIIKVDKIKI